MIRKARPTWRARKLDELGFVGRGRSRHRPRNAPELYGGTYPFFQTGDIKAADLYLCHAEQSYSEAGLAQSKLWEPGTLCITIAANIAETAILAIPGCFPDSVVGFVANKDEADVRFVKYYIDLIKLQMQNVSKGTTQDNLSLDKLLQFDFAVPSLDTQRKIASILSAYDDLIENNKRRVSILEEMAQSLYREWFVEFRFPGYEKARFIDSTVGRIPEGWHQQLGHVITLKRGYDLPQQERRTGAIPLVSSSGITDFHDEAMVKGPGVVTGRYGTLGEVFYVPEDFWPLNTTLYVQDFHGNEPLLVVQLLRLLNLGSHNAAGAVPGVNRNALHLLDVAFPPITIQKHIASSFDTLERSCRNLRLRSEKLRTTRDLLLPKLMSGQVDVEDLDIDVGESLAEADA